MRAAQLAPQAACAAGRIRQRPVAVADPRAAQHLLRDRPAGRAAASEQQPVLGAHRAPPELPAQQPGTVLPQAVRAELRGTDQHLVCLHRVGKHVCRGCGLLERAVGVAGKEHPAEHLLGDSGRERDVLTLAG